MESMKRIALALLASAVAATALLSSTAAASGPAPPGKEIIEVQCEGVGSITVSVSRSEHAHGVGQIVGQKGHGIPVLNTFTLTDVTTGEVLFSETETTGGGNANHNQRTTRARPRLSKRRPRRSSKGTNSLPACRPATSSA